MRSLDGMTRHVVLLGLMGSGKTTVGRIVAARLGRPYVDSDATIETREGVSARAFRERDGTRALHELEARLLLESVGSPDPAVIGAAASTIDDPACRRALGSGSVLLVWLTAQPATAAGRFGHEAHRPRYGDDPAEFLARQAAERGPLFRSLGPVELATDERSPEELAQAIVSLVSEGG